MSTKVIERQLADLQRRMVKLEAVVKRKPADAWRDLIGWAKNDRLHREAARLGAKWRAKANREGK